MQPIPTVTPVDVERVIRRDFPTDQFADALNILDEYGKQQWERGSDRVQLAILKLAAGSLERLRYHTESAKSDYRDVLLSAEYPAYGKKMFRIDKLPEEERQKIIDADWQQYQEWLTR